MAKSLLKLGKTKYELRYDQRAWYKLEARTGQTVVETFDLLKRGSFKATVDILWAGLSHDSEAPDPEELADLVPFDDVQRIVDAINKAMPQQDPTNPPTDE